MDNTKPVETMSIEEMRRDFQSACMDYERIKEEGTTGRNAWSLIYIERRIKELRDRIDTHDKKIINMR